MDSSQTGDFRDLELIWLSIKIYIFLYNHSTAKRQIKKMDWQKFFFDEKQYLPFSASIYSVFLIRRRIWGWLFGWKLNFFRPGWNFSFSASQKFSFLNKPRPYAAWNLHVTPRRPIFSSRFTNQFFSIQNIRKKQFRLEFIILCYCNKFKTEVSYLLF